MKYILDLWDTIGQENLRTMNKLFYNNSRIVIFVYDITSRESFEDLNYWINEVSSQLGDEDIIRGIIGNKIDLYLQEAVNDNDVEKLTKKIINQIEDKNNNNNLNNDNSGNLHVINNNIKGKLL